MDDKNKEEKKEREVSEKEINDALTKIMDSKGVFDNPSHTIKFLAKIVFNLRFDLNELKQELIKMFSGEQGNFEIEIAIPEQMKVELKRLSDDYFS